jgi:selenocysteine lyase/cysteine desulfurase
VDRVWDHNRYLAEYFYSGLQKIPRITVISPREKKYRTQMITFKIEGKNFRDVAYYLFNQKIRVRVVPEAGLDAIRVSFHIYNQEMEVKKILQALNEYVRI